MYNYLSPVDDGLAMRPAGPWAKEKLDYLNRYIAVFETAMRDTWRERNYIDLMAGPGKNRVRETGEVLLGSPLLALTTRYPFTGYHFVDLNEANIVALRERCLATGSGAAIRAVVGDCNTEADTIVDLLRPTAHRSLNLAFLDPEGLELQWNTVAKLASLPRMDLVINYPEGGLNRLMRKVYKATRETSVDRFSGDRQWRDVYRAWMTSRRLPVHRQLIDLYKRKLAALGYVEIHHFEEPLVRNTIRSAPLYRLLFASKHPLGDKFWHEVTRRDVYGQRRLLEAR